MDAMADPRAGTAFCHGCRLRKGRRPCRCPRLLESIMAAEAKEAADILAAQRFAASWAIAPGEVGSDSYIEDIRD